MGKSIIGSLFKGLGEAWLDDVKHTANQQAENKNLRPDVRECYAATARAVENLEDKIHSNRSDVEDS